MIKGRVMSSLDSPLNEIPADGRHHVKSMLMRESLLDKQVMSSTETPVVRMLPFAHVLKIGGRSIIDKGRKATYPLVDALAAALQNFKLVLNWKRSPSGRLRFSNS